MAACVCKVQHMFFRERWNGGGGMSVSIALHNDAATAAVGHDDDG